MNLIGLLVEIIYIFMVIKLATFFLNKKKIKLEESRKLIHIGLCNTYLIAWLFFDNVYIASILPLIFVIINYYSNKHNTIKSIERQNDKTLGTVWYALSLFILVFVLFYTKKYIYLGAISVLILGYADGFAGLLGKSIGKHKFKNKKSLEGSLIVFILSYIITYLALMLNLYDNLFIYSFVIASYATILEVISIKGLDNFILPIMLTIIMYFLTINEGFFVFSIPLCINLLLGLFANGLKFLDFKGSAAAVVLGTTVCYLGGVNCYLALLFYFILANSIAVLENKKLKKNNREERSLNQVLCNGLIPFASIIFYKIFNNEIFLGLFLLGLSSSCSDTFGGDFGKTSNAKVRYILSRKEVKKGTSGGITIKGLVGSFIASLLVSLFSFIIFSKNKLFNFITIMILSFLSSIIDSIMGELIQVKYQAKEKKEIIEKIDSKSNNDYVKISGFKYIGNSTVNFLSIVLTSIIYLIIITILI